MIFPLVDGVGASCELVRAEISKSGAEETASGLNVLPKATF